jgi:GTP-binding protein
LLLHLVDIAPIDPNVQPADEVKAIAKELSRFSNELAEKPRWLVINKIDLLSDEDLPVAREMLLEELQWEGQVFEVSAATGAGTEALGGAIMQELEVFDEVAEADEEYDPASG